jgi:hypothetical protein
MTTEVSAILVTCDRLLGEIGRRDHMFGWLRTPSADGTQWLAVDAYYPSNRLVVLCGQPEGEAAQLCSELIPAHGLRLLRIEPHDLPDDPAARRAALERTIAELGPAERSSGQLPTRERPIARAVSLMPQPAAQPVVRRRVGESRAAATARGARFVASRQGPGEPRRPAEPESVTHPRSKTPFPAGGVPAPARAVGYGPLVRRPPATQVSRQRAKRPVRARQVAQPQPLPAPGLLVGLALIVILCLEMFLGVADLALSAGHVLLAFGIALDACSRALGTIAAQRVRRANWVWACAILGSPAVLAFALYGSEEEVAAEPAPLAGLLSLLACGAVGLYLVASLLHL